MGDTPNTLGYFVGGYVVIFGVLIGYLISLWSRMRNLKQENELLDELEKKK